MAENGTPPDDSCTLPVSQAGYTLTFQDAPGDPCLPGGRYANAPACANTAEPSNSYGGYQTHLAGVNPDGSPHDLEIGFDWVSNYNGTTGGANIKKTNLPADGNGTGGITIMAINETTHYDPSQPHPAATMLTGTQVSVAISRFVYSPLTFTYNGTVTLTNESASAIAGPLQVVFDSLAPMDEVFPSYSYGTFAGWPYLTIPNLASLNPGQRFTLQVQFFEVGNAPISFIPIIYSGRFD